MNKKLRLALGGLLFALVFAYTVVSFYDLTALFHSLDERGWNAAPEVAGVRQLVVGVDTDSPAANVLREGDEVIAINDRNVERSDYKMESAFRPVRDGEACRCMTTARRRPKARFSSWNSCAGAR